MESFCSRVKYSQLLKDIEQIHIKTENNCTTYQNLGDKENTLYIWVYRGKSCQTEIFH